MKIHRFALLIPVALALLLGACIPSLFPFYTKEDVVFRKTLIGDWKFVGGKDRVRFAEVAKQSSYVIISTDEHGKKAEWDGVLFRLGEDYFLDLLPRDVQYADQQSEWVGAALIPGHLLAHVVQFEPALKLGFFNWKWLERHLEENPTAIGHYRDDDQVVLTAETTALQRFVQAHLASPGLFAEAKEYTRIAEVAPAGATESTPASRK